MSQKRTLKGGGRITLLSKEGHLGFFLKVFTVQRTVGSGIQYFLYLT
jgi:hypothetical protein